MATLTIGGKQIQVSDSFLQLSPEEQQQTVNSIAAQLQQQEPQRGFLERTADWWTGSRKEENIPLAPFANLQLSGDQARQMTALLATTASDERLKSGIERIIPDAKFETDQYGNLVVIAPVGGTATERSQWTRFYPNPQGLDATDIMQGAGAVAAADIAMYGAPLVGGGLLGAGVMGGIESGAIEAISSGLSGADYKWSDIPWGAVGSMLGVKLGDMLTSAVNRFRPRSNPFNPDGTLTTEAEALVRAAGLDPSQVTNEMAAAIAKQTQRGVPPQAAATYAEGMTLPVPVKQTVGQTTGEPSRQLFEDAARKGVYGEQNAATMLGFREMQQQALRENIPAINARLAQGGTVIPERRAGAAAAQSFLTDLEKQAYDRANDLYAQARNSGTATFATPEAGIDAFRSMYSVVDDWTQGSAPQTHEMLGQVYDIMRSGGDVNKLYQIRQRLTKVGDAGTQDAAAARALKLEIDAQLARAVDDALLAGDTQAISNWSTAIKNYAEFASTWRENGILKRLTERSTRDGERGALVVDPNDAAKVIFGSSVTGLANRSNLVRDLRTLRSTLPTDQWNQVRQEMFMTIMEAAQRNSQEVSGSTLYSSWNSLRSQNPVLIREMFSPEEIGLINQYTSVANRIAGEARNTSNSATSLANITKQLFTSLGSTQMMQAATRVWGINMVNNAMGAARLSGGTFGAPPAGMTNLGAAGIGVGAMVPNAGETSNLIDEQINRTTGLNLR